MEKQKRLNRACLAALLLCSLPLTCVWGKDSKSEPADANGWPRQLATRKQYPSKCGLVYASSDSAAAQVSKLVDAAVKQAIKDGVKEPKTGLVLVVDKDDKPPFSVEQLLTRLAQKKDQKAGSEPKKAVDAVADSKKKFEEMGLDMNLILSITPMPIEPNMLPDLISGLPQDTHQTIAWCVAVPTEANIRYGFKTLLDAGMKKENIGLAKRVAMAPLLAIAEAKAISEIKKNRQDVLCDLLSGKQVNLTDHQRYGGGQDRKP